METKMKMLNSIKVIGAALLTFGMIFLMLGLTVSGYSILTPIGIGTVIGAVFIFLMGTFFVITEEMLEKRL